MTDKETVDRAVRAYCSRHGIDAFVPKAALIDMDGTLIDSMRNHAGAWYRLSRELGLEAAEEEFYLFEGMTGRATVRLLFSRCKGYEPSDAECDELYERKARYFNELPRVPVIPGAARMLSVLTEAGVTRVRSPARSSAQTSTGSTPISPGRFRIISASPRPMSLMASPTPSLT